MQHLLTAYRLSLIAPIIGVLAVQGNFAEHRTVLEQLGVFVQEVRTVADLETVQALVIPGGESTVMMKFIKDSGLDAAIVDRITGGMPVLGTCAGAIVLSDSHLKVMDISVDRNAYGSQLDSFQAQLSVEGAGDMRVVFIRAPKITRVGTDVRTLCAYDGTPVIVCQGSMIAASCHPEMCGESGLHTMLLNFL